ncbi:MAG: hypothetical protein WD872_14850 [Pirellulaceae bacterium]
MRRFRFPLVVMSLLIFLSTSSFAFNEILWTSVFINSTPGGSYFVPGDTLTGTALAEVENDLGQPEFWFFCRGKIYNGNTGDGMTEYSIDGAWVSGGGTAQLSPAGSQYAVPLEGVTAHTYFYQVDLGMETFLPPPNVYDVAYDYFMMEGD